MVEDQPLSWLRQPGPADRHLMRSQKIGVVMAEQLDPSRILQIGSGFWPAKVLLSAVELELFTRLAKGAATGAGLAEDLGLAPRAVPDFPDALVALGLLERDGEGDAALYRNTPET